MRIVLPLTLALLTATALPARAVVEVIDQESASPTLVLSNTGGLQSFQQAAANISGAGVYNYRNFGGGTGEISLWTDWPGANDAIMLASGSGSLPISGGAWLDVHWTPVLITPDTTYYLDFSKAGYGFSGNLNEYSRGQFFFVTSAPGGFSPAPGYDATFHTFSVTTVPEAGSASLLLFGLVIVGTALRRRFT